MTCCVQSYITLSAILVTTGLAQAISEFSANTRKPSRPLEGHSLLLPFNGRWGFGGNVIGHAIDTIDFIDDAGRHTAHHLIRDRVPIGRHPIHTANASDSQHVFIRSVITHDADRANRQKHTEPLPNLTMETVQLDLFSANGVSRPQHLQALP